MGLCLDAWRVKGKPGYPIDVKFKFGGSGISIGDEAIFEVTSNGDSVFSASIIKPGDKSPYLRTEIKPAESSVPYVEFTGVDQIRAKLRDLPYYRNCFVCGHHRDVVGLKRRFRVSESNGNSVVMVEWGAKEDRDLAESFLIKQNELHPAVLISIFDENTAWGGFMTTRSCGVSVRMDFRLLRPVLPSEQLIFLGRPAGIKGNPKQPRFYFAEGAIYSIDKNSHIEPVACGRGEWLIMDFYTKQIKQNLLPEDDWQWLFL